MMKWSSIKNGRIKFTLIPRVGWDDASIWFTWLCWFIIAERGYDEKKI